VLKTSDSKSGIFVCLGSNIDPAGNLPLAIEALSRYLEILRISHVYESAALGAPGSPPFLNGAVELRTDLEPMELKFEVLRVVEAELGRRRTGDRNQPRTIDLDLALYHQWVIDTPGQGLVVPDPDILACAHVAVPLADLAADVVHPVTGQTVGEIARSIITAAPLRRVSGVKAY
jgi:2-amino-4-hydroxy-6-hydroxymethyldihydropteridine diphosphokinase